MQGPDPPGLCPGKPEKRGQIPFTRRKRKENGSAPFSIPRPFSLPFPLPHAKLRGDCLTRNRKLVTAIVRSQAERLGIMLGHAETLARDSAFRLQAEAQARIRALLGEELDRLRAMAAVNPNVRREELAHLEGLADLTARHLERTSLRLDALRLIVTG
jgi:ATP-dependent helicase HepA